MNNVIFSQGARSSFVNVMFDVVLSSIHCKFLNQNESSEKSCSVVYGSPNQGCSTATQSSYVQHSNTVIIGLPSLRSGESKSLGEYCFTITASNGTFTTKVAGRITTGS